jgi:heavy metal efflux system protein
MTKDKLIEQLNQEFNDEVPGAVFNFSQYIQDNIEEALSGVKGANSVKIIGRDLAVQEELATQVVRQMQQVKGITDLGIFHVLGQPNLNVKIDREKTARYGLNTGDVNTTLQAALGGAVATTLLESDRQFNVTVRLPEVYRDNLEAVGDIKIAEGNGGNAYIPLRDLATITLDTGASYIYHESSQRYLPIKFSVRGRDLGGAVSEAQSRITQNVKLPNGYRLIWAGEFEDLQKAQERLAVIVPISLVFILVLLYGLFNSLRDSLMALAGIPFAIAGGIIALYVTDLDFSVSAAIGFVSLFGVSVMDGILMIIYYNQVRHSGMDATDAMFHAATQRSAADADDRDVGLHRPVPGRDLHRHRQPGAATPRDRRRRRPADRPDHAARRRAGAAPAIPRQRPGGRNSRRRLPAGRVIVASGKSGDAALA